MNPNDLISIQRFCRNYNIPFSFITKLSEYELIEIIENSDELYIHKTQIKDVEKMIRLHFELDINIEGVDVIKNLLKQIELLQNDISSLNNRLGFYEDP